MSSWHAYPSATPTLVFFPAGQSHRWQPPYTIIWLCPQQGRKSWLQSVIHMTLVPTCDRLTTPSFHSDATNFSRGEKYKLKAVSSTRMKKTPTSQTSTSREKTSGIPNSGNLWHPRWDSRLSWAVLEKLWLHRTMHYWRHTWKDLIIIKDLNT